MADLHDRGAWLDYRQQRQSLTQLALRTVELDQARYYAALSTLAQHPSFQIVLEHWAQVLWLVPDYKQITSPEQVQRLFWKQAFLKELLEEVRVAGEKSTAYSTQAAGR